MKVKIIKCSEQAFWYKNHIGDVFEVEKGYKGDFKVDDNNKYKINNTFLNRDFVIDKEDCEIIKENDMKELKIGDEVEVLVTPSYWEKRIFIKHGKDNTAITVYDGDNKNFKEGRAFDTVYWHKENWRIPKEPKYRPFKFEERHLFRGRWVREKNGFKTEFLITEISENSIKMNGIGIGYLSLLEAYEFTDGSPCGVEIKE